MTRRIAVVGPVSPYRSGVAKHTTEIARHMAQRDDCELTVLSFARQYPRMLFPGDDDKAPDAEAPRDVDVDYCLDSVNPLTWIGAARRLRQLRPELVIMPAWTFFLAPCLGWVARACRRAGLPVVMVVHNVADHEASGWKTTASRYQLAQASRFVTHGHALAAELRAAFPDRPVEVHPHPIFDNLPAARGSLARQAALELLFFGLVREYKGLDVALRALDASGRTDAHLAIVGEFWEQRAETEALIQQLGLAPRVTLVPRYVSDAEAAEYLARADAVVLPYRSVTGSGVVAVAYHYGKPVLVSDLPGLTEVVDDGRTGWISPVGDVDGLAAVIANQVSADGAAAMRPAIEAKTREMSWPAFVATLLQVTPA